MQKHKILHIFPSFEVGGSQRRLVGYINRSAAPFDHYIYAMDDCYSAGQAINGFKKAPFPAKAIPKNDMRKAIKTCRKLMNQMKPDLIVTYNWGSIEWNLANLSEKICPTVHIQDGFAEDEQSEEKFLRRMMRGFSYRRASAVVVPSNQLREIAASSWKINAAKLHYIPNGIDVDLFDQSNETKAAKKYGIEPRHTVIGTIARLKPEKNIGRLIEAYSKIENDFPDTKLVIVGDGMGMAALKMLAERICIKDNVIFTGNLDRPEEIVPAFDIFALSSDTEQMPISVLEAMAAGKPVVSTDVGDVKAMVAPENTSLVDGMNAGTLAASIAALLSDTRRRKSIGFANQKLARERYSLDKMIETYDNLFTKLAS